MKQYKINYVNFMKGGVLITNKIDDLPQNYVLLKSEIHASSGEVTNPVRVDITDQYVCGGNSCIYGPPFEGTILRLSLYRHKELNLTELVGYRIVKDISTLSDSDGKQFIMTVTDFGLFEMIPGNNISSPFNCISTPTNIIGENCIFMNTKGVYGIIEYCEGGDLLGALLDKNNFTDIRQIKTITKNVLRAVAFLHKNEIIHCDLKLENIALKQRGNLENIRLIDFGGAKKTDDGNINKLPINIDTTPREVDIFGHSKKSDIYSIGCMIIKILIRGGLTPLKIQPVYDTERHTKKFRPSPITIGAAAAPERSSIISPITIDIPDKKRLATSPITVNQQLSLDFELGGLELPKFIDTPPSDTLYDINSKYIPAKFKSTELGHFCRKLLDIDFDTRYTAEEALSDPWLADV